MSSRFSDSIIFTFVKLYLFIRGTRDAFQTTCQKMHPGMGFIGIKLAEAVVVLGVSVKDGKMLLSLGHLHQCSLGLRRAGTIVPKVYQAMLSLPAWASWSYADDCSKETRIIDVCHDYSFGKMALLRYQVCYHFKFGPGGAFTSLTHPSKVITHSLLMIRLEICLWVTSALGCQLGHGDLMSTEMPDHHPL